MKAASCSGVMPMLRTMPTISRFSSSVICLSISLLRARRTAIFSSFLPRSARSRLILLLIGKHSFLSGQSDEGIEMALPVAWVDVCVRDGVSAVDHHPVTHIDADMGGPCGVVGPL